MGQNSSIEWTTHTFNPWWGCTAVSDGCKFCYAETLSKRYGHNVWGANATRRLMSDNYWGEPAKWNAVAANESERPRVFCASMADVFDERAPEGQRERLWEVIQNTPNLDWLLLTKRPHRIAECLPSGWGAGWSNVWLGTSVEDSRVVQRIEHLVQVPAALHFLSLEPLIGPLPDLALNHIEWAIVGGESGVRSRPMALDWVRDIQNQCTASNVDFFFKQMGTVLARELRLGKDTKGGHIQDFPKDLRVREIPGQPRTPAKSSLQKSPATTVPSQGAAAVLA